MTDDVDNNAIETVRQSLLASPEYAFKHGDSSIEPCPEEEYERLLYLPHGYASIAKLAAAGIYASEFAQTVKVIPDGELVVLDHYSAVPTLRFSVLSQLNIVKRMYSPHYRAYVVLKNVKAANLREEGKLTRFVFRCPYGHVARTLSADSITLTPRFVHPVDPARQPNLSACQCSECRHVFVLESYAMGDVSERSYGTEPPLYYCYDLDGPWIGKHLKYDNIEVEDE